MAVPLNQLSGMPQMRAAFAGWTTQLTFKKITQQVVDGWVQTVETAVNVRGVWQPMSPEDIVLKPEGQRSWSWFLLHIEGNQTPFQTNDRLEFQGTQYKVMGLKDYRLNNYVQYEAILDFQDSPDV